MASPQPFTTHQLLSYDEDSKSFRLNDQALEAMKELRSPVYVVSGVGDARIGKSTLLNMVCLLWDPSIPVEPLPFAVGHTTAPCTDGVWIHSRNLSEGSLMIVDVEGSNLGNDSVTAQLSSFTAVMSSLILLFVRQQVRNADLKFLYHTTKLGKMFPNSEKFPMLCIAIRDPLDIRPPFQSRHSEIVSTIACTDRHTDGHNEMRKSIAAVFPPHRISVCEIKYQDRNTLKDLTTLGDSPYHDNVQKITASIKETLPPKETPQGMKMSGQDLADIVKKLFHALQSGDVDVLQSEYYTIEKQICDKLYRDLIEPLSSMSEQEFMSQHQHRLSTFTSQCKIKEYCDRVQREIDSRKQAIQGKQAKEEADKRTKEAEKAAEREKDRAKEAQMFAMRAINTDRDQIVNAILSNARITYSDRAGWDVQCCIQ